MNAELQGDGGKRSDAPHGGVAQWAKVLARVLSVSDP